MSNKTHYRRVFKSDHLGCADLEDFLESGHNLVFTISHVSQQIGARVAGRKIDANIAYFVEKIKPLVLNATNSKTMKSLTGSSFLEDWGNTTVKLYIDPNTTMKGEVVGGVRISPNKVNAEKAVIDSSHQMWAQVVAAYKRDGNFDKVLEKVFISPENQQFIVNQVADNVL